MGVAIKIRRLEHGRGVPLPCYATPGAAGADLCSAQNGPVTIEPGDRFAVATGLVLEIPTGFEGQVRPRSGLALKKGIALVNSPGTIDADYRGEIGIIIINHGSEPVEFQPGDRVAQLIIDPVTQAALVEASE